MAQTESIKNLNTHIDDEDDASTIADKDRGPKSKSGQSKPKDLSHVPCKFFKVGSCTAGPSCPFSHVVTEPGQQKQVCTWFVKGSCKFGHKCALAHVLPGQPMTMDRRNKKAAQLASANGGGPGAGGGASGAGVGSRERSGRHPTKTQQQSGSNSGGGGAAAASGNSSSRDKNTRKGDEDSIMTTNTSANPNRSTSSRSGPPGGISAPVPAPPLRDTDFAFGLPDDLVSVPSPPPAAPSARPLLPHHVSDTTQMITRPSPLSTPARPSAHRFSTTTGSSDFGYGPIGSPPRSSPSTKPMMTGAGNRRINGFSPATSPTNHKFDAAVGGGPGFSSSPFSAPGSKSLYLSYGLEGQSHNNYSSGNGLPSSVGDAPGLRSIRDGWGGGRGRLIDQLDSDALAEDEDLEEFLPSSLNELLTPAERERRRSRSGGVRPSVESSLHHRYSRSVPATSLLDNIKSIWGDGSGANGEPGSYTGGAGSIGNRLGEFGSEGPSPSLLGTSNASAAFLPTLHRQPIQQSIRTYPTQTSFEPSGFESLSSSLSNNPPISTAAHTGGSRAYDQPTSSFGMHQVQQTRIAGGSAIPSSGGAKGGVALGGGDPDALSPTSRAIQSHAPGQSLPQGLAAGLSRLHLIPFSQNLSPGSTGDWSPDGPRLQQATSASSTSNTTGLTRSAIDDAVDALSFARTTHHPVFGGGSRPNMSSSPPTHHNVNNTQYARRPWLVSPRARPVATNDEDVLFTMDEEK